MGKDFEAQRRYARRLEAIRAGKNPEPVHLYSSMIPRSGRTLMYTLCRPGEPTPVYGGEESNGSDNAVTTASRATCYGCLTARLQETTAEARRIWDQIHTLSRAHGLPEEHPPRETEIATALSHRQLPTTFSSRQAYRAGFEDGRLVAVTKAPL